MRRLLVLGAVGIFLVTSCIGGFVLVSASGWLLIQPQAEAQPLRIAPLAPIDTTPVVDTPTAAAPAKIVESPPGLLPAAVEQPPATRVPPTATPSPTATPAPVVTQAGTVTRLVVPKLDLDRPIHFSPIENGSWQVDHLYQAVGYLEGTARPGEHNNFVLAGHVTLTDGTPGPFAELEKLMPGDLIIIYEGNKEFYYIIETLQTVDRASVEVTYPSNSGQITLITCTNWDNNQGRYINRLVVKGRLIEI